jgi:hypothetical protein
MADIFLSYSSKDRLRVKPIRDALASRGFTVFWDVEVPATVDWDTWIRARLSESRCALVLWSSHSVASENVRHEAFIAKQQTKIVPALLDPLSADQFPMGFYVVQAANLTNWSGAVDDAEWLKVISEIERKLTPEWMRRKLDDIEAELVGERARRETAERRDRSLRQQIVKEAEARQQLQAERDDALHRIDALNSLLEQQRGERAALVQQPQGFAEPPSSAGELDRLRRRVGELGTRARRSVEAAISVTNSVAGRCGR